MEADDVMPNEGSLLGIPIEPADQIAERREERAKVQAESSKIKQVITHFDERIKFRDSVESINVDFTVDPALHQKVMELNKMMKQVLIEEKQFLEEFLDAYDIN